MDGGETILRVNSGAWGASDAWGVPNNFFGTVTDEFYAVLGRLTALSSLLELQTYYLVSTLDRARPQHVHAGQPVSALLKDARRLLTARTPELRDDGEVLLDRVRDVLAHRNALIHGVWPSPSLDHAFAWRPVRPDKRSSTADFVDSFATDSTRLAEVIAEFVQCVEGLMTLRDRVTAEINRLDAAGHGPV